MKRDVLSEATAALRETEEASELEARSTRARVLTGLRQTAISRRTRAVFLLPIAATFVGVSAWGASNGNAHQAFETLAHWLSPPPSPSPPTTNAPVHVSGREAESRSLALPVAVPNLPLPTPAPLPVAKASAAAPPAADPTLDLYRAAHTAHFVEHDPARALAGWDAYLAAAPNGAFAPEARYNRALSLVRLGRSSEAKSALEPFANGAYGGYRKAEASSLLQRLEQ